MPVPFAVGTEAKHGDLLTGMQGEEQRCEAGGGVPAVALRPVLMDVLEEGWAQDQHLVSVSFDELLHSRVGVCELSRGEGAGHPLQIQWLKGDEDKVDTRPEVHRALRVHEVMGRPRTDIHLKARCLSSVHPQHPMVGIDLQAMAGPLQPP